MENKIISWIKADNKNDICLDCGQEAYLNKDGTCRYCFDEKVEAEKYES